MGQKKEDREVHRKAVGIDIENQLREWERSTNEQREGECQLRVSPEELHRVAKKARKSADQEVVAAHRKIIKRAVMAGSTPNIDMGLAPLVNMMDTVPVLSSKRTRGEDAHFWVPRKGTSVRIFWSGIGGEGDHMGVPGTWHPATVTTMEWPDDKGEPGLYLRYTDGMEEWTAISLFGDTVVEIESTKKVRRSAKDKKRKQGAAGSTDKFPESATEWLGYGATVRVKFKGKWCPGTVIGREHEAVMIQYEDGIKAHRDLHTRGCKIKTFRRRIDLDERYRQDEGMKCPFRQEDDECVCYRCRTEKWPGLYATWALTESQEEHVKSIEPSQRREWAKNHVIGEHLFANSENVENGGRSDERGGSTAAQSIEEAEREDADQEAARGQAAQLERSVPRDRQAEGGHHLGMRSGAHLESSAHKRGHDSDDEPLGAFESERARRVARRSKRKVAPGRAERVDRNLAGGERGAGGGTTVLVTPGEAEPAEGLEAEDAEHERPQASTDGLVDTAGGGRDRDTPTHAEQGQQEGQVGIMDRGLGELDDDGGMAGGGGGRKRHGSGQEDGGRARDKRRTRGPSAEPRGGMEVDSEGGAEEVPHGEDSRSRQEGLHVDGLREGLHHSGGTPRLVAEELGGGQRLDIGGLQESVSPGDGMGRDKSGTGVHPLQCGERTEHHQGMRTWEARGETIEHSEHDPRETGGGATGLRGGESRSGNPAGITRASPAHSVPAREPLELGAMGVAGGHRNSAAQPTMGDKGDRQMRLRPQGEEANEDIDQSASLDPEGQDRERALQGREVHGVVDEQRPNGAPRTNVPEHQGEETRHGSEEGREVRERAKGGQKRARGGAHCGDVRNDTVNRSRTVRRNDTVNDEWYPTGPNGEGEDTRERKKREMITETMQRRLLKKRIREEESKGGKAAAAPEDEDDD